MIFDPIPKKHKHQEWSFSKPTVIEGSTGAAIKNISVLEDALPTNRDYRTLNRMQMKFQNWRKLENGLDESDGEAMGEMLMANSSGLLSKHRTRKMKEQRVKHFFEEFHAMKTMKNDYDFFEDLIETIVMAGKGRGKGNGGSKREGTSMQKLALLSKKDGRELGASFVRTLGVTATEDGAYRSWVQTFPAMGLLGEQHRFVRPLLTQIGKEINGSETWTKFLLAAGASLASMLDVATDCYTIWYYRSLGLQDAANLMTAFVALSIGLQVMLVVAIHHKSKRRVLLELLATVTFTKQGFNFWRTYTNATMRGHELMPPVSEMMMFQVVEVFSGE